MNESTRAELRRHLTATWAAVEQIGSEFSLIERWGAHIAAVLTGGGRLLAAGNGGSAAQAQHLTAELVGRYLHDRRPLSAIALHAETSALTAITNDYGPEAAYARQVDAHGRPGDVLVALSTSGQSSNVVAAARRARAGGLATLALTGPRPNPLAGSCDACVSVDGVGTPQVQEAHLVVIHLLCAAVDAALGDGTTLAAAHPGQRLGGGRP